MMKLLAVIIGFPFLGLSAQAQDYNAWKYLNKSEKKHIKFCASKNNYIAMISFKKDTRLYIIDTKTKNVIAWHGFDPKQNGGRGIWEGQGGMAIIKRVGSIVYGLSPYMYIKMNKISEFDFKKHPQIPCKEPRL